MSSATCAICVFCHVCYMCVLSRVLYACGGEVGVGSGCGSGGQVDAACPPAEYVHL